MATQNAKEGLAVDGLGLERSKLSPEQITANLEKVGQNLDYKDFVTGQCDGRHEHYVIE